MTKLFNLRLLHLICFIMSVGLLASCDKEDDVNSGMVELLSFGPTGAKHGDTLRIIGNNLNKVSAVQLKSASVAQADFKKHTSEEIHFVIPASTEPGMITLVTEGGNIVSKTPLNLEVAVTIASITPEVRPGSNVTITGNNLNWVTRVTFAKDKMVDSVNFVSKSINQLVVTVPADAQTGELVLAYGGTKPLMVETTTPLRVTLPAITSMAPNPVKHQSDLTLTGTNLDLVTQIRFTGVTTPVTEFVSKTATSLVVKVPAAAQKGKITLVVPSGVTVQSSQDVEMQLPVTTALAPRPIDPQGDLTITGTNLDLVTGIRFPGVTAAVTNFISRSATQIVVKLPAGATRGKLTFTVLNSTLTVQSAQEIAITGDVVETPFTHLVYDDQFRSNWVKWDGWGTSTQDIANREQAKSGSNAIKVVYNDNYGAVQLHPNTTFPVPGNYSTFRLSIYGGNNATASSRIAIYLKDATDPTDAQKKVLTIVPGRYTTFEIPLSDFTNNPAKINELVIQNFGTSNLTIYIDEIGFY